MRILILTNHQLGLYRFRRELLERMVCENHEVYVSVPRGEFNEELRKIGVRLVFNSYMNRRGTNILQDIGLLVYYKTLIKGIKPHVVLTYTIKPNIYGGIACGSLGIPYIVNVTGLGSSIQNGGIVRTLSLILYKMSLSRALKVFFQNDDNRDFMIDHNVVNNSLADVLPGSGVNIDQNCYEPYPDESEGVVFSTIGRIMKEKGIDEILCAAEEIKKSHPNVKFRLIGDFDEEYREKVREYEKRGVIKYYGFEKDIHPYIATSHAVIHASYHEGMSNVLLETASTGRPVIASNVHGCIETFDDRISGIAFTVGRVDSLVSAIEEFLSISKERREEMGRAAREKMKNEFDRRIVVDKYMKILEEMDLRS